ncbi:MAG TPA: 1-acyl-sn-glycerol-3-phosphate acyltransferase [Candidatus Desulfofervidus auxilii]|uniref:1-acyl-sn-glycerol-3-phosphate acyltransferase n=1 Tax=Desulfofervidus auxilii TaxID=1621989 RepID=A0A7C0U1B8_DESA2|nr:1-acyl-sn-glycerol-3-phosphate acyltransferase [Candidatus Desulfofervidus auxilii]
MLRFFLVFIWIAIISFFFYPPALITSLIPYTKHIPHILARYWAKTILWVSGVKVKILGLENIDFKRPYVFAANHQSQYDIFTLLAHLPIQFKWMAKKSLFYIPLVGWGMKACGYIPVERENPKAAYQAILKALEIIKQGFSIIIFPEGTRSLDGNIRSFKSGGFVLALRAKVPIVPVSIIGTFSILPKSGRRIRPGNVTIIIDRPIDVSKYTEKEKTKLANLVREIVVKNYERYKIK